MIKNIIDDFKNKFYGERHVDYLEYLEAFETEGSGYLHKNMLN